MVNLLSLLMASNSRTRTRRIDMYRSGGTRSGTMSLDAVAQAAKVAVAHGTVATGPLERTPPRCCARPVRTPLAHCSLQELANPCLDSGGQLLQREGRRPHVAVVEGRLVTEAECCVPRLEFMCALKEADDLAVLCICGHPVPEPRRQARCGGCDDGMQPFGYGAVRRGHRSDLREYSARFIRSFGA